MAYKRQHLFLTVLDQDQVQDQEHGCVLMKVLFLVHGWHFLAVSSQGVRDKGSLWSLLYKGTNPIHEGCAPMTSQRPPSYSQLPLGVRIQHLNFGGHKHSDHSCMHEENSKAHATNVNNAYLC